MANRSELTMLVVGDVLVQREDPPGIFQHVAEPLQVADFTLGNLEAPMADCGFPSPKGASLSLNYRSDARQIAALQVGGFDAVGVANNHSLDYGYEALAETMEHLDRIGVLHAGAGTDKAAAHVPAIMERAGCRVALLAYSSVFMPGWEALEDRAGLAVVGARTAYEAPPRIAEHPGAPPIIRSWALPADKQQLSADIASARSLADIVVCSFHWGVSERHGKLAEYQVEVGHHAIDSGADLVFGHHPHMLQAVEAYSGRAIFYSLGNFVFDAYSPDFCDLETMIVRCRISSRRIVAIEFLPVLTDEHLNPHVLDLDAGRDIVRLVEKHSAPFGTRFVPIGDAVRLVLD